MLLKRTVFAVCIVLLVVGLALGPAAILSADGVHPLPWVMADGVHPLPWLATDGLHPLPWFAADTGPALCS
jgi:hypothetical protein